MSLVMAEKERITVMLDIRIFRKLRSRQAKQITDSIRRVSFSRQINEDLAKYYKMQNYEY